jgi:hypothetical protein
MVISNSKYGKNHAGTKNKAYWSAHEDPELRGEGVTLDPTLMALSQFEASQRSNRLEGFEE